MDQPADRPVHVLLVDMEEVEWIAKVTGFNPHHSRQAWEFERMIVGARPNVPRSAR
jgi:hypothetical protein